MTHVWHGMCEIIRLECLVLLFVLGNVTSKELWPARASRMNGCLWIGEMSPSCLMLLQKCKMHAIDKKLIIQAFDYIAIVALGSHHFM